MKIFKKAGYWNVQSEQLKEKSPEMKDSDLQHGDGNENEPIKGMEPTPNAKDREELIKVII